MKLGLLVLTNGRRDCIERTLASLEEQLDPLPPAHLRVIVDDSGDEKYRTWLARRFPSYKIAATPRTAGYARAMRAALIRAAAMPVDWLWVAEDDFVYRSRVDVAGMATIMEADPGIAQLVLKRQAWFQSELAAGGLIERFDPALFVEREGWLEHRVFWSMNPHLARRALYASIPWPLGSDSEKAFGRLVFAQGLRVGLMGGRADPPVVEHIGELRVGTGY